MANILVIDDDNSFRKMLRLTLQRLGHVVIEGTDGNQATRLCENNSVDLVITDIIMPDKEGIETILELKRNYPRLKIIAMSGGGRVSAASLLPMAKQLGADHTLAKPFTHDQLSAALDAMLPALS